MTEPKMMPRPFLKQLGFAFDKKPAALDRAFLKAFSPGEREAVELTWAALRMGSASSGDLYALPKTEKQAALLFSHDANRIEASLKWFSSVVAKRSGRTVVDVGCGAGYLLRYLCHLYPDLHLTGIDRAENLVGLIGSDGAIDARAADYTTLTEPIQADLVICDFGWEASDIPPSTSPHSSGYLGGQPFCPGCSDDAIPFFAALFAALDSFAASDGAIAIMGRLTGMGDVRALVTAADRFEWQVDAEAFNIISVKNASGQRDRFPAMIFTRFENTQAPLCLDSIGEMYGGRGTETARAGGGAA